jgi:hypothetical protein
MRIERGALLYGACQFVRGRMEDEIIAWCSGCQSVRQIDRSFQTRQATQSNQWFLRIAPEDFIGRVVGVKATSDDQVCLFFGDAFVRHEAPPQRRFGRVQKGNGLASSA